MYSNARGHDLGGVLVVKSKEIEAGGWLARAGTLTWIVLNLEMSGVLILKHTGTSHVRLTLDLGRSELTFRPNRTFANSPLDKWNLVLFAKFLSNLQINMNDTFASKSRVSVSGIKVVVLSDPLGENNLVLQIIPAREVSFLGDYKATERRIGKNADPVGTGRVSYKVFPIGW